MSIKQQRILLPHYTHTSNLIIVHFQLYFLNTQKQAFLNNQYLKFDLIFQKLFIQLCQVLVAACGIFSCGMWIWYPDQGSNSGLLNWEPGALATGPPRKSDTHTHTHTRAHTLLWAFMAMCTHTHTHVALGLHGNVHTHTHTLLRAFMAMCTHTHTHTHTRCSGPSWQCAGFLQLWCRAHRLSCSLWAQLPHSMWESQFPNQDQTGVPCTGRCIFNYYTTREVPVI